MYDKESFVWLNNIVKFEDTTTADGKTQNFCFYSEIMIRTFLKV